MREYFFAYSYALNKIQWLNGLNMFLEDIILTRH